MFFSLFSMCLSFVSKPGEVIQLDSSNWDQFIDKRSPDSVWMVMFYGDHCPACKVLDPMFNKASQQSDGMVNFGRVNDAKDNMISMRFGIKYLPTFLIIHKDGKAEYTGKKTDRAFVNAAAKFIPDKSLKVSEKWISDGIDSVILFTDKKQTPPMWSAISCVAGGKVRVGITDDPALKEQYSVQQIPSILFVNKSCKVTYNGKLSFLSLISAITEFTEGVYEEPLQLNNEYYLPEEYNLETEKFTGYCIIHASSDLDTHIKEAHTKYNNNRLKFFYGEEDLPYDFMKPGDVYIFAPKRNLGMKLGSTSEVSKALDQIFNGTPKWTQIEDLQK